MLANSFRATRTAVVSSRLPIQSGLCGLRTTVSFLPTCCQNVRCLRTSHALKPFAGARRYSTPAVQEEEVDFSQETLEEDQAAKTLEELPQLPEIHNSGEDVTNTLFIGNLYPWTTKDDLRFILAPFGEVEVRMKSTSSGQNRGFAHAEFTNSRNARKALQHHLKTPFVVNERHLRLSYAESRSNPGVPKEKVKPCRTLYIGNLPYSAKRADIQELLQDFGKIERIRIELHDDGRSKGYAHVDFEVVEDAQSVLEQQWDKPLSLQGREVWVSYAKSPVGEPKIGQITRTEEDDREVRGFRKAFPPSVTLWVGGMPPDVTEEDIHKMFEQFYVPKDVRLVHFKDKRPHSFAHVDFATKLMTHTIMEAHRKSPLKIWETKDVLLDYAPPAVRTYPPHFTLYTPSIQGDEYDVKTLFGKHARHIRSVAFHNRPLVDPSVKSAFIEFDTVAQATAAKVDLNGKQVKPGVRLILHYGRRSPLQVEAERSSPQRSEAVNYGLKTPAESEVAHQQESEEAGRELMTPATFEDADHQESAEGLSKEDDLPDAAETEHTAGPRRELLSRAQSE